MNTAIIQYDARIVHVYPRLGTFLMDVSLGFGVTVKKTATLHPLFNLNVAPSKRDAAMHCLVILVGGKQVRADLDAQQYTSSNVGCESMLLDEKIADYNPLFLSQDSHGRSLLDVFKFMGRLAETGFNKADVIHALNAGTRA